MTPKNTTVQNLQDMPYNVLSLIVSKVGATSSLDYYNTILTCKDLYITTEDSFVAKDLNLHPLVLKPRQAKKYKGFMDIFLRSNNIDAHYMQGIIKYFEKINKFMGLHHLHAAARGGHKEESFIYGVLLMALGLGDKGKKFLTNLTNEHGFTTLESIWDNVQLGLNDIDIDMKKVYHQSLPKRTPVLNCHPAEFNTSCSKCFHYYFVNECVFDDGSGANGEFSVRFLISYVVNR